MAGDRVSSDGQGNAGCVVGIGASAGGIEALSQFFDAMAADSGAVFIVVLHLDPTRESQLASILARHTAMPVREIRDGTMVEANHVYVIAPNHDLTLAGSRLRLTEPPQPRGHRHPVDVLFKSLAEQRQERAIAIVLSGTGTNGTQGLKEIRAFGGLILVQDTLTARFDGMPHSAISAGLADHVLAPGEMPAILLGYLRHGYVTAPDGLAQTPGTDPAASSGSASSPGPASSPGTAPRHASLVQILGLLGGTSIEKFRSYKPSTLLRRINRRMSLRNLRDLADYVELLRSEPGEVRALANDLLISVTGFFRDTQAWAALGETVIAPLVADRENGAAIRIWVTACATGEEAYSVAMAMLERATLARKQFDVKIFASDLLEDNLAVARTGIYPASGVDLLSPARVRRFFENLDGSYQVSKELRDLIVFARHDMLCDPPFSRMDLITCRNMLIYIEPEAQKRILALFHFALRQAGGLFLGPAETVGRNGDLYETLSKTWRIYRRAGPGRHDIVQFRPFDANGDANPGARRATDAAPAIEPSARVTDLVRRVLLDRYVPASVLIDRKGRVLYFHSDTGAYLKQPAGEPTRDLLSMAREGLLAKLRSALLKVIDNGQSVTFDAQARQGHALHPVRVTIAPLPPSQLTAGLLLVTFEALLRDPTALAGEVGAAEVGEREISGSQDDEVRLLRTELQSTVEQFESVNEELKASNEEAISMNEELQSTNEELETSKEELQSFNEELHSINSQLEHKIRELEETGNDLSNLLSGTEIATLFLDSAFCIKWFSPATRQLFDLVASDVGRPIGHFSRKFADERLLGDAERVLETLTPIEVEIAGEHGSWFLRRMLPYRTRDNRIDGLAITFVDVTERRRSQAAAALLELNRELEQRVAERTSEFETANRLLTEQIAARQRIEEELRFLAHHDRLTGLPNRRQLGNLLPAMLAEAARIGTRIAVFYLDLDRFKAVNDALGHQAGDALLQVIGQRLTGFIRATDVVARVGGDEFVAVLTQIENMDDVGTLAGRIIESLGEEIGIDGHVMQVGVSIGITIAPGDGSEPEALLQNADMALYRAKSDGGNSWKFFEADMAAQRMAQQTVEADLRRALAQEEFELRYQPMVDVKSGRIAGFEALLRWRHPEQGLLSPESFIRVAEECGLIVPIGAWVLGQACSDAMRWPDDVVLAVNLSAVQVRHRTAAPMLVEVLARTGLAAGRLELEVTESVLLEDNAATLETLHQLRRLGLRIAMDDFGTGYSSLSHLRSFPYSKIKVDLSFIRVLEHDENALVIVRAILALGAGLRMIVTAEGVETTEQLRILADLGCAQVQGYLLGHPIPADAVPALLAQRACAPIRLLAQPS